MQGQILIVDDEIAIRDRLGRALSEAGFAITTADDGKAALVHLAKAEFDVVISDVRMSAKDGVRLLDALRNAADDVEIIILSSNGSLESAVAVLREGAFDYIHKPFIAEDLVATVKRALDRKVLRASTSVYQASQLILSATEPSRLPAIIVEVARQVMAADDVSLMLHEPGRGLHIAYSHGLSSEIQAEVHLDLGERVAGRVAATRKPALLNGGLDSDPLFADLPSYKRVRSSIIYPLCRGDDLLGVLNVSRVLHPRLYQWRDVERASVLAAQALLALENRRLTRQLVGTERLAAVGEVAAGLAHEINNPLGYVFASLESLSTYFEKVECLHRLIVTSPDANVRALWGRIDGGDMISEAHGALDDAHDGTKRIRDIVADLRLFARRERPVETTVDVNEAMRSALRIAGSEIRRKAQLVTSFGEEVLVKADAGRMAQVILNLLVNAAQALDGRYHERNTITAATAVRGDKVVASVSDNGSGIRSEDIPHLFQPFFTTKPPGVGTGLGLSISRDIVHRYGGDIEVVSELSRGSTFTVVLPRAGDVG